MEDSIAKCKNSSTELSFIDDLDNVSCSKLNPTSNPDMNCVNDSNNDEYKNKCTQPNSDIPTINIPGNFKFIDDISCVPLTTRVCYQSIDETEINRENTQTLKPTPVCIDDKKYLNLPCINIPGNFEFIDDSNCVTHVHGESVDEEEDKGKEHRLETVQENLPEYKILANMLSVNIPGNFDFIDDNDSSIIMNRMHRNSENLQNIQSTSLSEPQLIFKIPSIYLPTNLEYIDDGDNLAGSHSKLYRGNRTHTSLRIPKRQSSKRLCRHHSDSETKASESTHKKPKQQRKRSKRIRRSASATETNKDGYKPRVRRSVSERSGRIVTGKHLLPPRPAFRPHGHYENGSSRCSSTKSLSTNVSISEIVAVEMGFKDIPGLTPKEARHKRIACTIMAIFATIVVVSVLLIAVTLLLSPAVDAVLRKGNEEIYRSMAAGASTSSPTTEGVAIVANNSAPPNGSPG